ncbi:MAG: YbgC/FadM family acyl-CoA thioesterase [Candidatus Manganitrophaceae bacterium]|nr:MAG: YbgC/FadM family acyl-CoA thioesterase [Candidatus Manganitrophaceae bacterium]
MQIRVYYEDTDAGGVVYYANYLKYFERGRTEYFRERGREVAAYAAAGTLFVVAHAEIDYRLAARYNDLLEMETEVVDFSRASLTFSHLMRLQGTDKVVVEGWVRLVCVDEKFKPKRLPEEIVQIVTKIV